MDDLARKVERAAHNVEVVWDPARQRRVESRIESAITASRWPRTAGFAFGGLVAFAAVALTFWPNEPIMVPPRVASHVTKTTLPAAGAQRTLRLDDGSEVQALAAETRWVVERAEREDRALRLERGAARFDLTSGAEKSVAVLAGSTEIRGVGAVFRVIMAAEAVTVSVEHGQVEVRVSDRTHTISASGEAAFPLTPPVTEDLASPSVGVDQRRDGNGRAARSKVAPRWDVLARDGDYEEAYARLSEQGSRGVNDSPGDLLLAADTARLSGHAARAVDYLERFLDRYASDPRAALTAFTLGRVHLQELGEPAKAAKAFALVRRLAPAGELAEDALAREVESWSRAGRDQEALSSAEEYVKKYPHGRRLHMVRRLGGL